MNTFNDLFKIILEGDKEASRKASRGVRKFLYSSKNNRDDYGEIKELLIVQMKYTEV
ncbi:MAG: hypothetical protein WCT42_00780 [Candidatus Paceibacterota bacterium]|jgi:hypothetical protein